MILGPPTSTLQLFSIFFSPLIYGFYLKNSKHNLRIENHASNIKGQLLIRKGKCRRTKRRHDNKDEKYTHGQRVSIARECNLLQDVYKRAKQGKKKFQKISWIIFLNFIIFQKNNLDYFFGKHFYRTRHTILNV